MRYIVISDSHGSVRDVQDAIDLAASRGPIDGFIHLGDGAADALASEPYLHALFPQAELIALRGNCDLLCDLPYASELTRSAVKLFLTHGHPYRVKSGLLALAYAARERRAQLALYGHTHIADTRAEHGVTLINPGALCARCKGRCAYADLRLREGAFQFELIPWPD